MRRRHLRLAALASALSLTALACDAFTGVEARRLELTALAFASTPLALHDSGVLFVQAETVADGVVLDPDERLPLSWTTSRGDDESTGMWHAEQCLRDTPYAPYPCYALFVTLEVDADGAAFATRSFAHGAVWDANSLSPRFGTVAVLDPRRLLRVAHEMQRWREVRFVEAGGGTFCVNSARCVASPIRLGVGTVRPRDGVLQIAVGDTITARYVNPAGDTLVRSIAILALQDRPQ